MSNSTIMSIAEMIDAAFGEADANIVNLKLIQAVLYLLARQLRVLERRVGVQIEIDRSNLKTNLSVTELKLHATVPKKRKKIIKPAGGSAGTQMTQSREIKKSETKEDKVRKSKAMSIDSETEESLDKISSKTAIQSALDKSSTTKSTSDKTSTDKTKSSSDKTSTDRTKSSSDKTSTDKTKSSSDKTQTDETKSSDKTSTERTKSSSDKTQTDETKSSDKTSSDKTKSSTDRTTTDKSKSSTDKTSSDYTKSDKTSSDKTKSSIDKSSTDKTKISSKRSSLTKVTSDISTSEIKKKDLHDLLERVEQQREKELRIIHQRADSRDITEKSPTPMASLDSVEEQYEKLLILERIPAKEARASVADKHAPPLSIVTQSQFEALADVVRELQSRNIPIAKPDFPDNVQLMQDLRKGASLTDAMAALQLSARLDAAEKTLKQMLELVTDLAIKSGLEIELEFKTMRDPNIKQDTIGISTTAVPSRLSKKSSKAVKAAKSTSMQPLISAVSAHVSMPSSQPSNIDVMPTPSSLPAPEEEKLDVKMDWVTYDELDLAIQDMTDKLLNTVNGLTTKSNANAENAIKTANRLEEKLVSSLNLGDRMNDLELLVSEYSEQINILDTSLSSQMTNYQEQLTQMQHDLEAGLEAMAEALANTGGDTVAVAELNTNFTNLQNDVDNTNIRQKELNEIQNSLSLDLKALWEQIELLRESKSDRDEVADALRDKAGLGALNGLVSLQQFHAVRGDFEKRIGAAYDKFNNQEIIWQKIIDDLLRELNDKADWVHLVALRDEVNKNLEMLRNRTHAMLQIVGEPRAAAVARQIFRDSTCLSCATPAHMDMEEPDMVPKLPAFPKHSTRPPTIGAEDSPKPSEDGDHKVCYPGLPIPHPRDPRAHICQRYCGGSHTLVSDKKNRTPVGITITPVLRPTTTGVGSDGKTYMIDDIGPIKKPCVPCNEKKIITPQPSEAGPGPVQDDFESDFTQFELSPFCGEVITNDNISTTPPPPLEDF